MHTTRVMMESGTSLAGGWLGTSGPFVTITGSLEALDTIRRVGWGNFLRCVSFYSIYYHLKIKMDGLFKCWFV